MWHCGWQNDRSRTDHLPSRFGIAIIPRGGIQTAQSLSVRVVMIARYFAVALLGPMLSITPAQAQDDASAGASPTPVYCTSRGPSIFTGRANAKNCVVPPAQPRCRLQKASVFTGHRGSDTCVMEAPQATMAVERPPIFSGRARRARPAVAATTYSQPTYTNVVAADGTVTQQINPSVAQPAVEAPKPKRRRASIFTGGPRRKD
jgi:hypothetical protein